MNATDDPIRETLEIVARFRPTSAADRAEFQRRLKHRRLPRALSRHRWLVAAVVTAVAVIIALPLLLIRPLAGGGPASPATHTSNAAATGSETSNSGADGLAGTTWILESVASGSQKTNVSSYHVTLEFRADQQFLMSSLCLFSSGKYMSTDGQLELTVVGSTGGCEPSAVSEQGHAAIDALAQLATGSYSYLVSANTLRIELNSSESLTFSR